MEKRRPSGDGMVRKRADGRWEGRIVVGHKTTEIRYTDMFLRKLKRNLLKSCTTRLKCIAMPISVKILT